MKRKDGCPLKHKGSQCAEQGAAENLTVCCKKSSELRHAGEKEGCERGFWEATRLQQVQAPHRSDNWALAPKHNSILGKTNVAGRIQGPPEALYILFQWLSYQSRHISIVCTLGIHTSPKREPTSAKEPPSVLRTTYSVAPGWMLVPGSLRFSTTEGKVPPGPFSLKPYRTPIKEVGAPK